MSKAPKTEVKQDPEEFLKSIPDEALPEVMQLFGVPKEKIPDGASREQMLELIRAAKRNDIVVAKTVSTPDGKTYECPPGHMIIKVTPKSGIEWGKKTASYAYFCVQGNSLVVKRGETHVVSDRYRSAWRDAIREEYEEQDGIPLMGPDGSLQQKPVVTRDVYAEDVQEIYWNRDLEAEKAAEQEVIDGAKKFQDQKKAAAALQSAVIGNILGMK